MVWKMCENAYIYNVLAAPRLSTADEKGKGYYAGKPVRPLIVNQIGFHPREVVGRGSDTQPQVGENYSCLFLIWNIWKSSCFTTHFIPDNYDLISWWNRFKTTIMWNTVTSPENILNGYTVKTMLYRTPFPYFIVLHTS